MNALRMSEKEAVAHQKRVNGRNDRARTSITSPQAGTAVSKLELRFAQQIESAGLPPPARNWYHIPGRDFTLDFAWPNLKFGVEVQGMAHRIKSKFRADIEKRALAQLAGWRVLEVGGYEIRNEIAIKWLIDLWIRVERK